MNSKWRSFIHVFIQFSTILIIVFPIDIKGKIPTYFLSILPAILLGMWSIWAMRKSALTVMPEPGFKFSLVSKGPYKVIRHPMYTSLFVFLIPFVIYEFNYMNLAFFILFGINQVLKIFHEERLLVEKEPGYLLYMSKTWRLIPVLF